MKEKMVASLAVCLGRSCNEKFDSIREYKKEINNYKYIVI